MFVKFIEYIKNIMKYRFLTFLLSVSCVIGSMAQSGTNSPYSQFGLGVLTDQGSGFNRGMNGLAIGMREHNQVNHLNPASYSSIDSLTFIFDAGLSGQITNFTEGGRKINANNADFEYAVGGFRVMKNMGVGFGLIPFTNVGYNYSQAEFVDETKSTYYTNTYKGSGGIHEVFAGVGYEPVEGLSVGFNAGYLWGSYNRSIVNNYSDNYINSLSKFYAADVRSYKLDFGVQYTRMVTKVDRITVGFTYGLGHKLGADPECRVVSNNSQTGVADSITYKINDALELPTMFGAGVTWERNRQIKVGFDYTLQKWGDIAMPQYKVVNNTPSYEAVKGLLLDRSKFTLGAEYCKNEEGRSFIERVRYRAGVSYATPYIKVNGADGPKEMSVSAGVGIPIVNSWNNRSFLNFSVQWVNSSAPGLIKENTFRLNLGLTFNERWFQKFKVK